MRDDEALSYWSLYLKCRTDVVEMAIFMFIYFTPKVAGAIKHRYVALITHEKYFAITQE